MCDVSDEALATAWNEVRDDGSDMNWCLFGYSEANKNKIALVGKGNGGLAEFVSNLNEGKVLFGAIRVRAEDQFGSKRSKFVFVCWIGEAVAPLPRARVSTHKPTVASVFKGMHVEIIASRVEELTPELLQHKLHESAGAHKADLKYFFD